MHALVPAEVFYLPQTNFPRLLSTQGSFLPCLFLYSSTCSNIWFQLLYSLDMMFLFRRTNNLTFKEWSLLFLCLRNLMCHMHYRLPWHFKPMTVRTSQSQSMRASFSLSMYILQFLATNISYAPTYHAILLFCFVHPTNSKIFQSFIVKFICLRLRISCQSLLSGF